MKHVLCFGDSNTWGFDPVSQQRFPRQTRWTGVLQQALGADFEVIEEGLNGRTTVWDDPIEGYKNGRSYLIPCIESHWPLDLVVIMLGTNDLKARFGLTAIDIAEGVCAVVNAALQIGPRVGGPAPRVLLMAPPPLSRLSVFAEMFEGGEAKSQKLGAYYRRVADELGCAFFDSASVITTSPIDGIHLEADAHATLGRAVEGTIRELLG